MTAHPLDRVLEEIRNLADSERGKGTYLESLAKQFLLNDATQRQMFSNVWTWGEWPDRPAHFTKKDNGIDLVAQRHDGAYTAVQVKFYASNHRIQKGDINSFLAESAREPFQYGLVIDTTEGQWSSTAESALAELKTVTQRIGLPDLRGSDIDWTHYSPKDPNQDIEFLPKKNLRPHQDAAIKAVLDGFQTHDRGKLIMACGTGKTFTSLKLAEAVAKRNGGHAHVLFMVPSLALMQQTVREWSNEADLDIHSYALCSDTKVGRVSNDDTTDVALHDLQLPATTDGTKLAAQFDKNPLDEGLTVVFSTYQSIDAVTAAQQAGIPDFDLIICDEAHRTTGAKLGGEDESHFTKIHDQHLVRGDKRVYMTATPRVFSPTVKDKAREKDVVLASMDDEEIYGPQFYYIGFGEAVTKALLTDYKVLVLGVHEDQIQDRFQKHLADRSNELNIDDIARLVGCWNGLAKRRSGEFATDFGHDRQPMRRAVAFTRDIKSSKKVADEFADLVRMELVDTTNEDPTDDLRVEVRHVDGSFNAIRRQERLDWLSAEPDDIQIPDLSVDPGPNGDRPTRSQPACRILTNARCLTEGVDVPSLDAVLFLNARNSQVDVIQAVGRVMRNFENKETGERKNYGYIILPIVVPAGVSTSEALNDNERYKVVWQVLQALRAHDERLDAAINAMNLTGTPPEQVVVDTVRLTPPAKRGLGIGSGSSARDDDAAVSLDKPDRGATQPALIFPEADLWKDAVYAKIVDKCGDRMYWSDWAKDVADIAGRHIDLIQLMLRDADSEARTKFDAFVEALQHHLNPSIDEDQAVEMLAQHLVTKPVFDSLFVGSDFTDSNPISRALQVMLLELDRNAAFEKERADLEPFYESVRLRAQRLTTAEARQTAILELYDNFFRAAFPRVAERLGIVFTPVEVVDYILRSADFALRKNFGRGLTDEGVAIWEPFVGTGTFITRLMQTGLIEPQDLRRKFEHEIFANEFVLLSYYIASINISTVYAGVAEELNVEVGDVSFQNIALTDTFQSSEQDHQFDSVVIPENSEAIKRRKASDIQVIVMNPPYSTGQKSANDNNQNQSYSRLDDRISKTYAAQSTATLKNSLYDSYIRGIRLASDEIVDEGVIAFVSNGSFIDGNTADGLRKTFIDEFAEMYVYNLRGNQRTSGETSRREGGKIFGSGSRTQVAIAVFVKRRDHSGPATLWYRDIGDYLTRQDKLDMLRLEESIAGSDWQQLQPNDHGDWINQRDENYDSYQPVGLPKSHHTRESDPVFGVYSGGIKTNRDAWCFNSSSSEISHNLTKMVAEYSRQLALQSKEFDPALISWSAKLSARFDRGDRIRFSADRLRFSMYRPFFRQVVYFDDVLVERPGLLLKMFPTAKHPNLAIVTSLTGSKELSALVTDLLPDLHLIGDVQAFALYTYEPYEEDGGFALESPGEEIIDGYRRRENITDATLKKYRQFYEEPELSKEDIFYYVYGLLHSAEYRQKYAADLMKMLPRIPKVKDFWGFSRAGRELAELHLNYESVEPYPLQVQEHGSAPADEYERYAVVQLRWAAKNDKSKLRYNDYFTLSGIPAEAHDYEVNGRSALDWLVDRYRITTHKESKITNNPNDYSREVGDPRYIFDLIARVTTVSVRTVEIVAGLPELKIVE